MDDDIQEIVIRLDTIIGKLERTAAHIRADFVQLTDVLKQIEELGHSTHHAQGYSLADLAEEGLKDVYRDK